MSKPQVSIRPADGEDVESVIAVGRRTLPNAYGRNLDPEIIDLFLAKQWSLSAFVPSIRTRRLFVAEVCHQIVGVCQVGRVEGRATIWRLYVVPDHQGVGVGSALLESVLSSIDPGTTSVYASIGDGNPGGLAFYRRRGFVEVDREPQSGMPDLIWMRRELPTETS